MKIVIAGAGEVGTHLARMLSGEKHDITVIDTDGKLLEELASLADVITIQGDSTDFSVLKKASVRKADLFIAVAHEESTNIISSILAKKLGATKSIARIDNNEYLLPGNKEIFIDMGIDYLFYPESIAAGEVINLLSHTTTTEYVDFSGGRLSLQVFRVDENSPMAGKTLNEIREENSSWSFNMVGIDHDGETIIPRGSDIVTVGDDVYIITNREFSRRIGELSGYRDIRIRNVMVLGGSRIGVRIASELQRDTEVKLVEYNQDKAYKLAEELDQTLIIYEDGRNLEAMKEENIGNMDAFIAVTGRSETNILAAMLAKKTGVKKVIAEVENMNYINLAENIGIDTIINKKLVTAGNIFRFTMSMDVQGVKFLTGSEAEVLEFIVKPNSPATREAVRDLEIPDNSIIGGFVRGDNGYIASGDTRLNAYDRVVVVALPEARTRVGKLFN